MKGVIDAPVGFLEKFGGNAGFILVIAGGFFIYAAFQIFDFGSSLVFRYIFITAPVWAPVVTFLLFFEYWLDYVRKDFKLKQGRVTLEIKLPQDIFKSPEAMELILNQLNQVATPDNHVQTYWDGKQPPVYGLEIVSREGNVKFYLNVPRKKFKNIAETQLYAQYPGIEVTELQLDYTAEFPYDPDKYEYFSIHFGVKRDEALPIKTYYEFGMQMLPKEEEKIDPLTSMLEALGSIGPGEHMWIQILIDANREIDFLRGSLRKKPDWKVNCDKKIKEIIDGAVKRADAESKANIMQLLTDTERDTIKAIERSKGKNAFNVGMRGLYFAEADAYDVGERAATMITAWRGYDDINRNAIGVRWRTDYDWNWWQDPRGTRRKAHKKRELLEYKRRHYEQQNSAGTKKVMTTEEIATIFHLPGQVALTPTLGRIPSTRSEAPPNLPTT